MNKRLICLTLALSLSGLAFAADAVVGLWKSIDEKTGKITAYWKVYEVNGTLRGEIITVPDQADDTIAKDVKASYKDFPVSGTVNKMLVVKTPWIWGLTRKAPGEWAGGSIIDPKDGKQYKCKITFRAADGAKYKADTLEMRGEIGLGIGRSQYWQRATETEFKK